MKVQSFFYCFVSNNWNDKCRKIQQLTQKKENSQPIKNKTVLKKGKFVKGRNYVLNFHISVFSFCILCTWKLVPKNIISCAGKCLCCFE